MKSNILEIHLMRLLSRLATSLMVMVCVTSIHAQLAPGTVPISQVKAEPEASRRARRDVFDVTFRVRYAPPGNGFREGVDGRLRVSDHGIRFIPNSSANGERWSVGWPKLKTADEAKGIWDVAHPLVIETINNKRYFIVKINRKGRYDKGDQILEYIEKGRRRG